MVGSSGPRVAVVGGGVIGSTCAYYLTSAGCQVTLIERDGLGGQAASAAAGVLVPSFEAEREGPWLDLATASLRLFPELVARLERETGLALDYVRTGAFALAYDDGDVARLRARAAWQAKRGLSVEWLSAEELLRLEPAISQTVCGALAFADGQHLSTARLVQALLVGAARRGARLLGHTPARSLAHTSGQVEGVRTPGEVVPADLVLLACGAWTGLLGEWLGLEVPVKPVKGQILALRPVSSPIRRIIYGPHTYLVPKRDGTVVLGATVEQAGFDRRVTAEGLRFLLASLPTLVPSLTEAEFVAAWAGLRPATPDGLPIIGRVPGQERVWVASGHFRNGVLLAPITGTLVAQLLLGQSPELDCSPFRLARFSGA